MTDWAVRPAARPLAGTVRVPGDKSIGHRALLLGALADGPVVIDGLSGGEDNERTARALEALGVDVARGPAPGRVTIAGVGLCGLRAPTGPLDCGNSGTTMRLLAGLLAGRPFDATLVGDASLSRRPMRRVAEPLARMGARLAGRPGARAGELYPPLELRGAPLSGIVVDLRVASAQVKSAIVLAALQARGVTEVREPGPSRDHTERMLAHLGAPVRTARPGVVRVEPDGWRGRLAARPLAIPGDPSSAAFVVAAALLAGGEAPVEIERVGTNPTRTGFLDALAGMGARVARRDERDLGGEPVADLVVEGPPPPIGGAELAGELVVRAIDEVPILGVVAARAAGRTLVRDAGELRVKETDRIRATVAMLRAFGVTVEERDDGFELEGRAGAPLEAAEIDAAGDHRIAMAAAVGALVADGESRIRDVANVATSFPGFAALLGRLGAEIREVATG